MMKAPSNLPIELSVTCQQCEASVTVDARANAVRQGVGKLSDALDEKGWQPLMLGKTCIGCMCQTCSDQALENDDDGEEIENVTGLEESDDEPSAVALAG